MFVTSADFDLLPYSIPNLDKVANTFQPYVDEHEEDMLRSLLGVTFYNSFLAGLAALPAAWAVTTPYLIGDKIYYKSHVWQALTNNTGSIPVTGSVDWIMVSDDKWLMLQNGADYILDTRTYHWAGMVKMLKPFIYSEWLSDTFDQYSGNGVSVPNNENANTISPAIRICKGWNDFAVMAGTVVNDRLANDSRFYQPYFLNGYYTPIYCYNERDTLYGFLKQNGVTGTWDGTFDDTFQDFTSYLEFWFKDPGTKNSFNI